MDGKPGSTAVPMTPPFFLNSGDAFIHMNIITPGFGCFQFMIFGALPFFFSAKTEFISVSHTADGAGNC